MPDLLFGALPLLPTSPVGRQREIEAARRVLLSAEARLLTLTGPPGVGKTTLAITVARSLLDRFPHGARFVDLAPVSDPEDVAPAIADRLNIHSGQGGAAERLAVALRDRRLLLVLDNFEQVPDAAPLVAALLSACARLRVLVTSRIPLLLRWEHELPVPPLDLADPARSRGADALAAPASALFVERARAANPYLEMDESTRASSPRSAARLDGLPLAIELAAAHARTESLQAIHRQLDAEDGPASAGRSTCWPGEHAICRPGSRRCARRSAGATLPYGRLSRRCCDDSPYSSAAARSTRRGRSARRARPRSPR